MTEDERELIAAFRYHPNMDPLTAATLLGKDCDDATEEDWLRAAKLWKEHAAKNNP